MNNSQLVQSMYTNGSYLEKSGGRWHLEDSLFKARYVIKMLTRHPEVRHDTICEIGCGSGGILSELQRVLPTNTAFTGYEISPQAHAISSQFSNAQCKFILGDAFLDHKIYDLVLVMDVVEHVDDCFEFLRRTRSRGRIKLYHFPLDIHVLALMRGANAWEALGHVHQFTIETALKAVEYTGHTVIDYDFTGRTLSSPNKRLRTRVANLLRVPLAMLDIKFAARLIGGFSILILAE